MSHPPTATSTCDLCCCHCPHPCHCPRRLLMLHVDLAPSRRHRLARGGGGIIFHEGSRRQGGCQWGVERKQSINQSIHQNFEGRGGYRKKWRQTLTITLARRPCDVRDGKARSWLSLLSLSLSLFPLPVDVAHQRCIFPPPPPCARGGGIILHEGGQRRGGH
jgi:hypothetical protein